MSKKARLRIFEIIAPYAQAAGNLKHKVLSRVYDAVVIASTCISIIPLFFKVDPPLLDIASRYVSLVFIVDYALNWITADFRLKKKKKSFLLYPVSPWAVVDLLAIIPFFFNAAPTLVLFRVFRLIRIFRIFKGLKYSDSFNVFIAALKKQKDTLLTLLLVTIAYIAISGVVIFNVEPDVFSNVLDAIFLAASSLTNIPITESVLLTTTAGKVIALVSSFWGIALIALPTGVITGSFMSELHRHQMLERRREREKARKDKDNQP